MEVVVIDKNRVFRSWDLVTDLIYEIESDINFDDLPENIKDFIQKIKEEVNSFYNKDIKEHTVEV